MTAFFGRLSLVGSAALLVLSAGCRIFGGSDDPVDVAKEINENHERGRKLLAESQGLDLDKMLEGIGYLEESVRLGAATCGQCRFDLAKACRLAGFYHYNLYLDPRKTEAEKDKLFKEARGYFDRSNREFLAYERIFHGQYPMPIIYLYLAEQHEILGDYVRAKRYMETLLKESTDLNAEQRRYFEGVLRTFDERLRKLEDEELEKKYGPREGGE